MERISKNYAIPDKYTERLTDADIQNFILQFLKKNDDYFEFYKANNFELERQSNKILVNFDYYGSIEMILRDYDALMIREKRLFEDNLSGKWDIENDWYVFLAKKFPQKYIKSLYKEKMFELKRNYEQEEDRIKRIIKGVSEDSNTEFNVDI